MQEIKTDNGMIFIYPFRLEYFYVYNEEYFKNKNIPAKISVLIKKDNIISGGATSEEITEKSKQLTIPYRYVYFIMENIRNVIASSFTSTKDTNNASSVDSATKPADDVSVFTSFLGTKKPEQPTKEEPPEKKEEPSSSDDAVKPEGIPSADNQKPSSSDDAVKPEEGEPLQKTEPPSSSDNNGEKSKEGEPLQKKEPPSSSDNNGEKSKEGEPLQKKEPPSSSDNNEGEPLKEMDTSDPDKLQRNEDKLLFKIEILEEMNKIKLDELPYVTREKIVNEIVNNNKYKHTTPQTNEEEKGVVYENNKHEILVIGNLVLDDKKALMLGIENTEVYNNLL
jgi:hypothetical protein